MNQEPYSQSAEGWWFVKGDTHIGKWISEAKRLDHDQNALPQIVSHMKDGDVVFDVGALYGDHTLAYSNAVGKNGAVYAFEPNPLSFECLRRNRDKFPFSSNTKIFRAALTAEKGPLNMAHLDNTGASHICLAVNEKSDFSIDGITLDEMADIQKISKLDFVKIDVEGYEVLALIGGAKTIKKFMPIMYVEVNEGALMRNGFSAKNLLDYIRNIGYSISGEQEGPQFDVFCYPL